MKTLTPEIAWHNRDPVYSVDIQPQIHRPSTGTSWYRLATSGTDAQVVIWKVFHGTNCSVEIEPIAQLTRHEKAVNVVRFSPTGEDVLASADVDGYIFIWKLDTSAESTVHNKIKVSSKNAEISSQDSDIMIISSNVKEKTKKEEEELNVEMPNLFEEEVIKVEAWTQAKTLRGHLEDVVDISWSQDGLTLVSASVDNEAIVWDVVKGIKLHMLSGHKSWVQGVSFDPISEYLVSICADRNLRVYDAKTRKFSFKVEKGSVLHEKKFVKTRLFYDYTLQSFTRRLCFSPGGEFLLVPSGVIEMPKKVSPEEEKVKAKSEEKVMEITIDDDDDIEMKEDNPPNDEEMDADNEEEVSANKTADQDGLIDTPKKPKVLVKKKERKEVNKKSEKDEDEGDLGYVNVCHLFLRQDLKRPFCYYPTDKFCHAVRFCPVKFCHEAPNDIDTDFPYPYRIIFAIATQSSVILYDTSQSDPFAYISDIHYTRISDLSWSPDGRLLMVSSTDGFCTFVTFEDGELGKPYDGPTYEWKPEISQPPKINDEHMEEIFSSVIAAATAATDSNPATADVEDEVKEEPVVAEPVIKTPSIANIFTKVPKSEALQKVFNSTFFTSPSSSLKRKETESSDDIMICEEIVKNGQTPPMKKKLKETPAKSPLTARKIEKVTSNTSLQLTPSGKPSPGSPVVILKDAGIKIIDDRPSIAANGNTLASNGNCANLSSEQSPKTSGSLEVKKAVVPRRVSFVTLTKPKEN